MGFPTKNVIIINNNNDDNNNNGNNNNPPGGDSYLLGGIDLNKLSLLSIRNCHSSQLRCRHDLLACLGVQRGMFGGPQKDSVTVDGSEIRRENHPGIYKTS